MADSNLEYWRRREQAQLEANLREEESYTARLDAQFALLERTIDQLIADFYQRYAAAEGISLADIEALAEKAKRYVELASQDRKTGSNQSAEYLSKMANDEMRLYNAMMRINRLELLKAEIGMEVDQTYIQMGGTMNAALTKRTDDELRRQAGILGETVFHNEKDVAAIVNGSFHNATFDQYIWKDCTKLKSNLEVLLTQGLIAGDNPRELARRLRKEFTASRYEAERLMRTELARVQTDAQKMSYERNGYDKYMFISTEDSHTCERCSGKERECIEKDGFAVEDMEIGENAPPMHPNCRCSTAAHISEADFEREMMEKFGIDMRDEQGKTDSPGVYRSIYNYFDNLGLIDHQIYFDANAPLRLFIDDIKRTFKAWRNPYKRPKTPLTINKKKQATHIAGTREYNDRSQSAMRKGTYGPSRVEISEEKVQELIEKYHGTGIIRLDRNGNYLPWEIIVDNDEVIGTVVNNLTGEEAKTTVFKIHYSKNGVHIVPDYPSKKELK